MKKILCTILFFLSFAFSQNIEVLDTFSSRGYMSDVWGYDAPDGRFYAISGAFNGVSVFDVTNPNDIVEIGFFPGPNSAWRDIKTYKHYAYIVNDTEGGLVILDLSTAPDSVRFVANLEVPNFHNLYIDTTTAAMYLANASSSGAVSIFSLENPEEPVHVKDFGTETHDLYVRNNTAYTAQGRRGTLGFYDVSNPDNPTTIKEIQVPNAGYVHNTWLSKNSDYLVTTEETANKTLKIWDITDLDNIELVSEYLGPSRLQHNAHVEGDYVYLAHYESGLSILDIHDPTRATLVGYFDTYPESNNPDFNGNWGVFPHSKSGNIYLGDMDRGFFVVKFNNARADFFDGIVSDKESGLPLEGVVIQFKGFDINTVTNSNGFYNIGFGLSDTVNVTFSAIGYKNFSQEIILGGGVEHTINVELEKAPKTTFRITVKDNQGKPIKDVLSTFIMTSTFLENDEQFSEYSDENGIIEITDMYISDSDVVNYLNLKIGTFPYAFYEQSEFILDEVAINELEVTLSITDADILVVNNDPNSNYGDFIKESLNQIGKKEYIYNVSNGGGLPSVDGIKKLSGSFIIWMTGDAIDDVISQAEIDTIKAYLMNGGNVILSGQNIAEHLNSTVNPFLQDWIHVNYIENMGTKILSGRHHQISDGVTFLGIFSGEAANNQTSPDAIEPDSSNQAQPVFEYRNSNGKYGAVGVEYTDYNSKLFFAGFGLEAVYQNNDSYISRDDLLTRISEWFDSPLSLDKIISGNPETFQLKQNYPNPFNPSTNIEYNLPKKTNVKIEVFSLTGQKIKTLVNEQQNKGLHSVNFVAENLASGIYFYKLQTEQFTSVKRMILIQ
ncbi:MAG: choice-of-anchor B family protein [Calditrichaeota bacterium]|nr:MAG: choice-of-anchor B family protein [Calditrichota bacterium]MBL1205288.1 choice-of-anchor B family protein [Calditrichota bacterium]NOG45117.1 choice-of-anchor B family protein [Calditrichota bacterium]